MGDWPLLAGGNVAESDGRVAASSTPLSLSAPGSNTESGWTQLIAATAYEADVLIVWASVAGNTRVGLVDIGIGGSGSEEVLIPNLSVSRPYDAPSEGQFCAVLPVRVPAGSRLAARCQSAGGATFYVGVTLVGCGPGVPSGFQRATDYGTDGSNSRGTVVDAGASANTKGSWVELVASTTSPIRSLLIMAHDAGGFSGSSGRHLLDIAIGPSSSEEIVLADLIVQKPYAWAPGWIGPIPVSIPAGTRIAARAQCSSTTTAVRQVGVNLIGLD